MLSITKHPALPWVALVTTVIIWAGYLVATRAAMTANLTIFDAGILRSLPAALILLPLTLRKGLFPGNASFSDIAMIGILGGTAFTLLLASGLRFAPAADSGIFAPSMLPFFVAAISTVFIGARYKRAQWLGCGIILIGALAVGGSDALRNSANGAWRGHLLFLAAAFSWAIYTVRFRICSLSPLDAAIILVTWSSFAFLIGAMVTGTRLFELSTPMLTLQIVQGTFAGLVANFTFLFSIRKLGHEIPAAAAALVPILAALGGSVFLNEPVTGDKWLGIGVVALGVLLASGLLARRQSVAQD